MIAGKTMMTPISTTIIDSGAVAAFQIVIGFEPLGVITRFG